MKVHRIGNTVSLGAAVTLALLAGCASNAPQQPQAAAPAAAAPVAAAPAQPTTGRAGGNAPTSTAIATPLKNAVYFDFDSYAIKDQNTVSAQASYQQKAAGHLELQGNADERGSREYNIALGQKRADSVKKALTALGAKGDNIDTISYGEDKPKAKGHDEAAWAENRRVDFVNK